jgi:KUP system potassium uptake protein
LRANVEHNQVMHEQVIIASVKIERVPHIPEADRVRAEAQIIFSGATGDPLDLPAERITAVTLRFGFVDEPDIPAALRGAAERQLIQGEPNIDRATYFLSQITIVPTAAPGMSAWRKKLFVTMSRNAADPAEYFRLPDDQTVMMSGRIQV